MTEINTQGNTTRITRLAGTPQAVTQSFTYEPAYNQLASYTDPLGKTWLWNYDASNRLATVTDPLGSRLVVIFSYNAAGQPLTVANGAFEYKQSRGQTP